MRHLLTILCLLLPAPAWTAQGGPVYADVAPKITAGGACLSSSTVGRVRVENDTGKMWCCVSSQWQACGSSVAGANTQIQFNDNGSAAGSPKLTFDKTTGAVTFGGATGSPLVVGNASDTSSLSCSGSSCYPGILFNSQDGGAGLLRQMRLYTGGVANYGTTGLVLEPTHSDDGSPASLLALRAQSGSPSLAALSLEPAGRDNPEAWQAVISAAGSASTGGRLMGISGADTLSISPAVTLIRPTLFGTAGGGALTTPNTVFGNYPATGSVRIDFPVFNGEPATLTDAPNKAGLQIYAPFDTAWSAAHLHVMAKANDADPNSNYMAQVDAYNDSAEFELYTPYGWTTSWQTSLYQSTLHVGYSAGAFDVVQLPTQTSFTLGFQNTQFAATMTPALTRVTFSNNYASATPTDQRIIEAYLPQGASEPYLVMSSANGSKWKITVSNAGALTVIPYVP